MKSWVRGELSSKTYIFPPHKHADNETTGEKSFIHMPSEHLFVKGKIPTYASVQFSSVQFSRVWLFATPWIAGLQASLSITNSRSLLKLMSFELVMPSSHLKCLNGCKYLKLYREFS